MKGRLKEGAIEGERERGGREISAKSLPFKCPHSIHSAPLLAGRKAGILSPRVFHKDDTRLREDRMFFCKALQY